MGNLRAYSLLILVVICQACNSGLEQKLKDLEADNELLNTRLIQTQEYAEHVTQAVHEVHFNLTQIKISKQKINTLLNKGLGKKGKSKQLILDELQLINRLQELNKEKIDEIKSKYDSSMVDNLNYSKIVEDLEEFKSYEETAIEIVKERLIGLNYEVGVLSKSLDSLMILSEINYDVIQLQAADLNTGYYCIGDFKSLSSKKIIKRKGGVLGIGSVSVVLKDFNKSAFTSVRISKTKKITVDADQIEILTTHPSSSYEILDKGNQIVIAISDPQLFWDANRYLVILDKKDHKK